MNETSFANRQKLGAEDLLVCGLSLLSQNLTGSEQVERWRPGMGNWPASNAGNLTAWKGHTDRGSSGDGVKRRQGTGFL